MIYLACPYSHKDDEVRNERFHQANLHAGKLIEQGLVVYSPISHTHCIAEHCELPNDWAFWERFDRAFLERSSILCVLQLEGWLESKGVRAEIKIAQDLDIPVMFWEV